MVVGIALSYNLFTRILSIKDATSSAVRHMVRFPIRYHIRRGVDVVFMEVHVGSDRVSELRLCSNCMYCFECERQYDLTAVDCDDYIEREDELWKEPNYNV